ncbi:MAG: hypothetical protein AB1609_19500 [Bacillota bacterium]
MGDPLKRTEGAVTDNGPRASTTMKSFMDVAFSVIVAECFTRYAEVLLEPSRHLLSFLAVIATIGSVVWSYVQFRISLEVWPYLDRPIGYCRFAADLLIVGLYGYQLYSIRDLLTRGSLCKYTLAFPLVFSLYIASGALRRHEHGTREASRMGLLVIFFLFFVMIAVGYQVAFARCGPGLVLNGVAVALPTVLIVLYRVLRGRSNRK